MDSSNDAETTSMPHIFLAVTLLKPEMFGQSITETEKLREEIREAQEKLRKKNSEVDQHQVLIADVHKQREESEREFAALIESFQSMMKQAADEKVALVQQVLKLQSRIKEVEFTGKTQAETIQRFAEDHKSPSSRPAGSSIENSGASLKGSSPRFLEATKSAQGKVKGSPVAGRVAMDASPLSTPPKPSIVFDQKLDQKHQKKQQDMELEHQANALKANQNLERERQERAVAAKARMDARKQKQKSTTEK
jgi:hypothetical protein